MTRKAIPERITGVKDRKAIILNAMTKEQYISKIYMNEDQFQAATYLYINNNYPMLRRLLFHVPNQGAKNAKEGAKLKAMGVIAGVPDLICLRPLCGIELKMPTGRIDSNQKSIHEHWGNNGIPVYVCWNASEVVELLDKLL